MKIRIAIAPLVVLLFAASAGAQELEKATAEHSSNHLEAEITAVVEAFHAASTNGDLAAIANFISNSEESFFLGSDATEIYFGKAAIVQWWTDLFDYLEGYGYPNGGLEVVSDGNMLQVRRVGNLILVADEAIWRFNNGDLTFRLTLVLRKEHGKWRILQGHFSNPFPNTSLPL